MSRFKNFISEALKPSQFRPLVKGWDKSYLADIFQGKYRIELPLIDGKKKDIDNDITKVVRKRLQDAGYQLIDYVAGTCRKIGDEKNILKVGKILQKIDAPQWLRDRFANDPERSGAKKVSVMVVISRHPYDIAGMSTDRGWTSCMTLPGDKNNPEGGSHCEYVEGDIKDGSIIAYLVSKNDSNITKPIARVLLKSYYNEDDPTKKILVMGPVYGTNIPGFQDTIEKWIEDNIEAFPGLYSFGDNTYNDSMPPTKFIGSLNDYIDYINNKLSQFGTPRYRELPMFLYATINPLLAFAYKTYGKIDYKKMVDQTRLETFILSRLGSPKLSPEHLKNVYTIIARIHLLKDVFNEDVTEYILKYSAPKNVVYLISDYIIESDNPKRIEAYIDSMAEVTHLTDSRVQELKNAIKDL